MGNQRRNLFHLLNQQFIISLHSWRHEAGKISIIKVTRYLAVALTLLFGSRAIAMEFVLGGTDHRSSDAAWIQATGPITENTLEDFVRFVDEGPEWFPTRLRLDSPGGNLIEGVLLGEELRRRGFATEVGNHEPHPDWPNMPYWEFTRRTPGNCASACAYAFLGGVERRISEGSFLGLHQFYNRDDAGTRAAEGVEQEVSSVLLDYLLRMEIDARILVNAGMSSPNEMYWIGGGEEAALIKATYEPSAWLPWEVVMYENGLYARSKRSDGQTEMRVLCNGNGQHFELRVADTNGTKRKWMADQCLPAGSYSEGPTAHRIFGNRVESTNINIENQEMGFSVSYRLRLNPVTVGRPSVLYDDTFGACMTSDFVGTDENFSKAVNLALRNCF